MGTPADLPPAPAGPRAVAIGASFGGVEALLRLAADLPVRATGPPPAAHGRQGLPQPRPAGEPCAPGHRSPVPQRRAVVRARGIGVVLTGHMDDGSAGLAALKACGGIAIVQDPATADAPGMPAAALANVQVDHCLPLEGIAPLLARLVGLPPRDGIGPPPRSLVAEQALFIGGTGMDDMKALGEPSELTCPDCGGTLSKVREQPPLRWRCHAGHAYTAHSLRSAQLDRAAHTLQASLRILREREALLRRLASVSHQIGDEPQARAGLVEAERVHRQSEALARIIEAEPGGA